MFICFDTEDNSKELAARIEAGEPGVSMFDKVTTQIAAMAGFEGRKYYSPGDVSGFLKWCERQPEKFIYANNVQYDLGNLFADRLDWLDVTLVGGRVISARWHGKVFLDVFNIWFCSVKKLGEAFGVQKLETQSMATDKDYVFRDVEIIHKAMTFAWRFALGIGLKKLPNTAGGVCFAAWKQLGGENCHDSLELSREAYYGGRVELFKPRDETGWIGYTDVNSLYPFVLQNEFPGVLEDWENELAPHGIARVSIDVPESDLPVLPYRNETGRITYPWGRFTGTWTLPEIREAERCGAKILKVLQCYGTEETMLPYQDIMQRFYAARMQGKTGAEREFFKRMMNAFYGRLGTTGKIGRTVWATEENRKDGTPFGEKVLVTYSMPLAEETNWSHAAYVTAYGRLTLLRYLRIVGAKHLIYCDTDSVIFDLPHPILNMQFSREPVCLPACMNLTSIPFETGVDLGQMKLESWEQGAEAWAPKMYRTGPGVSARAAMDNLPWAIKRHWKAKGVPNRLAREFIEKGVVHYDLPFKYREAVAFYDPVDRHGNPRKQNSKKLSVWRTVEKSIVSAYDRKKLHGKRFYPLRVNAILEK